MDRFNFLPQGLRRNSPAPPPAAANAAATTTTATTGTAADHTNTGQPAPLPAVYHQNQNQNRTQRPYNYPESVSSLSSDDEYEDDDDDDDLYEDEEVRSVSSQSSRDSDTAPLSPRHRQQRAQYPSSSSTLNRRSHHNNNNMATNVQDDLYCDLEAQLGIHPALRVPPGPGNVPANFPAPPPIPQQEEMAEVERRSSSRFFLPRMSFRFLGGGGRPRPASSHYSGDGLPPATEVNFPVSPKSPAFRIGEQELPSTRLHVPGVERTWSRGSNGPPTRDGSSSHGGRGGGGEATRGASRYGFGLLGGNRGASRDGRTVRVTEPRRTAARRHRSERDGERSERRREGGGGRSRSGAGHAASGDRSRGHRSRRDHGRSTTTGRHRHARDEERRRRRRKKKSSSSRRHEGSGSGSHSRSARTTAAGGGHSGRRKRRAPPPKHFLFCFPWVRSRTKRRLILRSIVSGMILACLLIVYLALSVTHKVQGSGFTIAMILVVVLGAIVFLHSAVRLVMLAFKGGRSKRRDLESGLAHPERDIHAPSGPYAIPPTPIRVVLARDEEAAGLPSATAVSKPPEYGQWRESVRVDPNRIYWMRNEGAVTPALPDEEASSEGARSRAGSRDGPNPGTLRRPPSYSSDDGVSYVVEAQPRSIAPATDVPTGGRAGRRLA
ncbi:uncharacterized protein B0T23DRAFT_324761 [Neurospora hispaniola]|uniref:Uncharacterized protein n=1 Tax=Neurospora hispaniola TaxID=588809 RepID=A0AAJ0I1B1_9PEZI|nr:hypothetical protein B0T23DRAFT_324761 [Neurospora hispaniola]